MRNYVFPEIEKNLDLEKIQFHFIGANHDDLPEDFKKKKYIIGRGYVNDLSFEIKDSDIFFCVTQFSCLKKTHIKYYFFF